jgi:acetyl-CoA carboxylase biotin carboxyl carrier protein
MDAQQIKVFIDAMAASDLAELHAAKDGWTLRLVRGGGAPGRDQAQALSQAPAGAAPEDAEAAGAVYEQCAALGGVVFLQAAPGAAPFVQPGQPVKAGQPLCVIEAMKIFNEVHAERAGVVEAILVRSGEEVEAGQPLMRLRLA